MINLPKLTHRIPQKIAVSEKGSFTRTLMDGDTALFIGATWDVNPLHTDGSFAAQTRFGRRIVPGLLMASLLTHIGGLWNFLATEMHFEFVGPVYIGDTITAVAEISAVSDKGWIWLKSSNSANEIVLKAKIRGYPGQFEAKDD